MELSVRAVLLAGAALALGSGCGSSSRTTGERMDSPLRFAASGKSCPRLAALGAVDGALVAAIDEQGLDTAFLGRARRVGDAWERLDSTTHTPFHIGSLEVSLSPEGQAFAALYPFNRTGELPDLRRSTPAGWEPVPLEVGLDLSRQNFPEVLALDTQRAVASITETGGTAPARQRAFLWQDGSWGPLEDYQLLTVRRSFHRGPQGQLWRATLPSADVGTVAFHEWDGSAWTALDLRFSVSERGFLRELVHGGGRTFALYDTTTQLAPGGHGLALYEPSASAPGPLVREPTRDLWAYDLSLDSSGRPVVSLWGHEGQQDVLRSFRLEDGTWRRVYEAFPRSAWLFPPEAAIVGDTLVVGRTESDQQVDIGFQHHSDCELVMERVDLAAVP